MRLSSAKSECRRIAISSISADAPLCFEYLPAAEFDFPDMMIPAHTVSGCPSSFLFHTQPACHDSSLHLDNHQPKVSVKMDIETEVLVLGLEPSLHEKKNRTDKGLNFFLARMFINCVHN